MGRFDKADAAPVVEDKSVPPSDEVAFGTGSVDETTLKKITKTSSIITVLVAGLALLSDGYNAQVIGYQEPFFSKLYPQGFSDGIATRLSNSYLIGEIFGMLTLGFLIDKIGRRTGVILATAVLVLGIVIATAAHGYVSTPSHGRVYCYILLTIRSPNVVFSG